MTGSATLAVLRFIANGEIRKTAGEPLTAEDRRIFPGLPIAPAGARKRASSSCAARTQTPW